MTPTTGDFWLADVGAATHRSVYVVSVERFHRLAERAVVAPVLPSHGEARNPPWWIAYENAVVALERLSSVPVDRLIEHHGTAPYSTVRAVQRAIGWLTGTDR
jgi:mRNA-degrading endonuclease toxin of MazEF toxin-antitoxin module